MRDLKLHVAVFLLLVVSPPAYVGGATCGSAVLVEVATPAVFDGVNASTPVVARFWEAGAGALNRSDQGCAAGCTAATAAQCAGGFDCLALTGVNWLNASCGTSGHLPARTVFVVEQTSVDSGGRWAAINLDHNASDANTDLDAKATAICGGCASVVSPMLAGAGYPAVSSSAVGGSHLTAILSWSAPAAAAQALSNTTGLVSSYAVYSKIHIGTPPPATGDRTGWVLEADLQADGLANGGFSTDTSASVSVNLPLGVHNVSFAIGLNFDGTGNPTSDLNVRLSTYVSDQSDSIEVDVASLIFADGFESGNTLQWSSTLP